MPRSGSPCTEPPRRKKGDIKTFSRSARRRLIKKMMRVERREISVPIFLTLTYHERYPSKNAPLKKELQRFLQSLRRLPAKLYYMWRIEWQKRGAPHFHLLIWHEDPEYQWNAEAFKGWALKTWHRVCSSRSKAHTRKGADAEVCRTWSKAMSYVCKYLGKGGVPDDIEFRGRHWGASRDLPTEPALEVELSEQQFYVLRRIIRGWLETRGDGGRRYAKILRQSHSMHVNLSFSTVLRLLDYIGDRDDLPDPVPKPIPPPPANDGNDLSAAHQALGIWHTETAWTQDRWTRGGIARLRAIFRQVVRCSSATHRRGHPLR